MPVLVKKNEDMKMRAVFFSVSCALLLAVVTSPAFAEDKALDRAQFMLRQLNAQKVQLEQKNAQLSAEIEQLKKDSEKQLKQQKAGNEKLDSAVKKRDEYIASLKEKLKETVIALRKSEAERLQANSNSRSLDSEFKRCVDNNHQLVHMNDKLIENYNEKSCWDSIVHAEPFTGIKQVEVENILQEYRFKNEDLEVNSDVKYEQKGDLVSNAPGDNF
jgi:chromosome segregation ATPase